MKFLSCSENLISCESAGPDETFMIGEALGTALFPGCVVLMRGPLGAGKTKIAQGVGAALGFKRVKSPSFTIMSEYDGPLPLLHADLYRLTDGAQVDGLGIEEYLENGFTALVEWAERWTDPPSERRVDVTLEPAGEDRRTIIISAADAEASAVVKKLHKLLSEKMEISQC